MSEFKGKIAVGVAVATIVAVGLAVGFEALTPSPIQSSTILQTTGLVSTQLATTNHTSTSSLSSPASPALPANGTIAQFHVPWQGATWFLGNSSSVSGGPALVANLTQAAVFDCASDAGTPQGCTQEVNGHPVTVWYPYAPTQGQAWPDWPNCATSVFGGTPAPAYCISIGANDFMVAVPQPGPA